MLYAEKSDCSDNYYDLFGSTEFWNFQKFGRFSDRYKRGEIVSENLTFIKTCKIKLIRTIPNPIQTFLSLNLVDFWIKVGQSENPTFNKQFLIEHKHSFPEIWPIFGSAQTRSLCPKIRLSSRTKGDVDEKTHTCNNWKGSLWINRASSSARLVFSVTNTWWVCKIRNNKY